MKKLLYKFIVLFLAIGIFVFYYQEDKESKNEEVGSSHLTLSKKESKKIKEKLLNIPKSKIFDEHLNRRTELKSYPKEIDLERDLSVPEELKNYVKIQKKAIKSLEDLNQLREQLESPHLLGNSLNGISKIHKKEPSFIDLQKRFEYLDYLEKRLYFEKKQGKTETFNALISWFESNYQFPEHLSTLESNSLTLDRAEILSMLINFNPNYDFLSLIKKTI
ncbi:MAG: hypothetical protein CL678_07400 [Bdellovibrionaceae bacterium]|nr:hypothetical protein [Pseudobdellovibrionaceae bacterium]|tara:strand:- start:9545 stop:10204 length:660 start_codon:yes stop_codon:yes gene_type:complete